jgi:DNA invertase Pin-like site-specific DNA recombinase
MKAPVRKTRCAIYTRVSTDERLDMEFNSLDAQREAALAYMQSQKHEGWILVGDRYDDGGFSGGTMDRPALQRLLRDVERGVIDVIVVYKVDRLSRVLTDFARIVEVFEKNKASFVSITQQFNNLDGPADAQYPAQLRPVRARGHRRAHSRQVCGVAPERDVDGRHATARLRRRRAQARPEQ